TFAGMWSTPALWPGDGGWVYVTTNGTPLQALRLAPRSDGVPVLAPIAQTPDSYGYTSGSPIVTSNGLASGSAVVWVLPTPGIWGAGELRAYGAVPDAAGRLDLLYRDAFGASSK